MKTKYILIAALLGCYPFAMQSQSAFDVYSLSQSDLRGSARFMSMAGAFGALGGDLSVLNQNPGGIGIYRSSELGLTLNWDIQNTSMGNGAFGKEKHKNFNFSNLGYIGTFRTGSSVIPNVNWGISYNRTASFNRHYSGGISNLQGSMTNYVANQTTAGGWKPEELGAVQNGYNPYQESYCPWMSILAYNSYLINPSGDTYKGLFQTGTTGRGELEVDERGGIDEYTLSFGGNAMDMLYWGASLGIVDVDYQLYSYYEESLDNAHVPYDGGNKSGNGSASWGMENYFSMRGSGLNFKLGVIFKPINEFRVGFAFHTPTFYSQKSEYYANTSYAFSAYDVASSMNIAGKATTDEGYVGETYFDMNSPWRFIGSAAAVVGGRGIISFDYERVTYPTMSVSYDGKEDVYVSDYIKDYYRSSNIFRLGGEFKVTPQFGLRLGYSLQLSPFTEEIRNDKLNVVQAGTTLSYTLDDNIQYITAGLGYRYKAFYVDMAYLYKTRKSTFHAYSPEVEPNGYLTGVSPTAKITDNNHEVVLSVGLKF